MEFRKPDRSGGKTCPVFDAYLSVLNGTTGKPKVFARLPIIKSWKQYLTAVGSVTFLLKEERLTQSRPIQRQ